MGGVAAADRYAALSTGP